MSLAPGTRLGPYEIVAPLGAGGMGEVFRARDTRLGREVAVKILAASLSSNPEVRARFEREARTVSSLNHPHICTLHDVGREADTDYLVMELVDGETLAARLDRGALSTAEVLRIGSQIADALDRAHRAGVVHRDLKPANVMLTKAGAKLMDFGLARAGEMGLVGGSRSAQTSEAARAAMTQSPTMSRPLTAEGTIIGTFQYMAPEQLEGGEADARSDIWALGCVLYEMATGRRAFQGKSQASLISAIMSSEPTPVSQVSPMSPPALDRLVGACLAKDPEARIQTAHDAKLQLGWIADGSSASGIPAMSVSRGRRRESLAWGAAAVLGALAMVLAALSLRGGSNERMMRATLSLPPDLALRITGDDSGPPALSPDGRTLAFAAMGQGSGQRLWLRSLDELTARPLPGTEGGSYPFWSPDGRSLGFFADGQLRRVDLAGGAVLALCPSDNGRGGTWSRDGVIVFAPDWISPLSRVPASGGEPTPVTTLDSTRESTHRWPLFLPDGKHFLYLAAKHDAPGTSATLWFASLDGRVRKRLMSSPSNAAFASGWLLFVRDSSLLAQRFDPAHGRLLGAPQPTQEIVQFDPTTWRAMMTASDDGLLA